MPQSKKRQSNKPQTIQQKNHSLFNKSFYHFLFSFVGVIGVVLVIVLLIGVQLGNQ